MGRVAGIFQVLDTVLGIEDELDELGGGRNFAGYGEVFGKTGGIDIVAMAVGAIDLGLEQGQGLGASIVGAEPGEQLAASGLRARTESGAKQRVVLSEVVLREFDLAFEGEVDLWATL
jgi:hypothetical protein